MFEWVKLFPPYLIVLTAVFVIIPTIASFLIRFSIYRHLNDLANKVTRLVKIDASFGIQPKIVEELETRYKVATSQLEQVNTGALIDGVYSQEKFRFFGFSLRCEQWDYFCRILPNLLPGLRQKIKRKQPQTQLAPGIYIKPKKNAETQVNREKR